MASIPRFNPLYLCFVVGFMGAIAFDGLFGDEVRPVVLFQVFGMGGTWHVSVCGVEVAKIYFRYACEYYYEDDALYSFDVEAIVERILDHIGEPWRPAVFHYYPTMSDVHKRKVLALVR